MAKKIIILITIITGVYIALELNGQGEYARLTRPLIVFALLLLYSVAKDIKKSFYLYGFLMIYSFAEMMEYVLSYLHKDVIYYLGNSLYIISYTFLIFEVCSNIQVKKIFKSHIYHTIILVVFSVFCIEYLTSLTKLEFGYQFIIELIYNIVLLVMISLAMLNFFSRPTSKSMYLLIGVVCLVTSEILMVANIYINTKVIFTKLFSILFTIGLFFIIKQAYNEHQEFKFLEHKNASKLT